MFFIIIELSNIKIPIRIYLHSKTLFDIIKEGTLIYFALFINHDSLPYFPVSLVDAPKIYPIRVFDQSNFFSALIQNTVKVYLAIWHRAVFFDKKIA